MVKRMRVGINVMNFCRPDKDLTAMGGGLKTFLERVELSVNEVVGF